MSVILTDDVLRQSGIWIGALILIVIAVARIARMPWFIGYLGELKVRRALSLGLDQRIYRAFHDLTLPTPDGTTQVDHVLVSRFGIFVIETKNWNGAIYGSERDRTWTLVRGTRRYAVLSPLRQNFKHAKAVAAAVGCDLERLHAVVVLAGAATCVAAVPANVVDVAGLVRYVRSKSNILLDDSQVEAAATRLASGAISHPFARWTHLRNLRRNRLNPLCPACGRGMTLRVVPRGARQGSRFWGCTSFPVCRTTRSVA